MKRKPGKFWPWFADKTFLAAVFIFMLIISAGIPIATVTFLYAFGEIVIIFNTGAKAKISVPVLSIFIAIMLLCAVICGAIFRSITFIHNPIIANEQIDDPDIKAMLFGKLYKNIQKDEATKKALKQLTNIL